MRTLLIIIAFVVMTSVLRAQQDTTDTWGVGAHAYVYAVPDIGWFAMPVLSVEHAWWYAEARYNYEDFRTGSLWFGPTFSGGADVTWDATPMLGFAFGRTLGWGPGLEATIDWSVLEWYAEGQYVFNLEDEESSYFYLWSELSAEVTPWLRLGAVAQRTLVIHQELDVSVGAFAGSRVGPLEFRFHALDPFSDAPYFIMTFDLDLL
jgi:hypothetical protein